MLKSEVIEGWIVVWKNFIIAITFIGLIFIIFVGSIAYIPTSLTNQRYKESKFDKVEWHKA
jgi:hypothetical protein